MSVGFVLNGRAVAVDPRPGESLLETLRVRCGITSVKDGCQPQGQCGCCLVLIDGNAKVSCATPVEAAAGKSIVTLEGVPDEERRNLARCFVAAAGLQCGFCIPGIALRAHHLLQKTPRPTRKEIARAIDGHLCRCTGYVKIIDAIELLARVRGGAPLPELVTTGGVGARMARHDGEQLVLGTRPFIDDMTRPGLLHGALVLSPHPRARVLRIDTTRARAVEGVVAVATAADVPGQRFYGLIDADWPGFVAIGEETAYTGDVLAAVAAVDEATAREAASLVEVGYEVLEPVLSSDRAIELSSDRGEPSRSTARPLDSSTARKLDSSKAPPLDRSTARPLDSSILSHTKISRGDAESALKNSAHLVRGRWQTQRIEHLFLEPESALAEVLDDGTMRLYSSGQGVFDDRRQVAAFLGIAESQLHVEQVSSGGAFGGKEDLSVQAQTALLSWMTRRPVKITLTRAESVRIHPKRHPITMDYEAGCDAQGNLTAVRARLTGDSGAYASVGAKVLERAAGHACGAYHVPNADIEAVAARTNNPPCGAMRGFGANQAHFAMEGCLDLLAKAGGFDPWELRWRNALDVGRTFTTGQVLTKSVGLRKTLLAVREAYEEAKAAGRAVGIACGVKNSGIGNGAVETGRARLVVEADGTVSIYNGFSEMGQGLLTVLVQMAVEVTGLPASLFRPKIGTRFPLASGQTTGSRATLLAGRAVVDAAEKLRAELSACRAVELSSFRAAERSSGRAPAESSTRQLDSSTARSLDRSTARQLDRSTARSLDRSKARQLDRSTARKLSRLAGREYDGLVTIDDTRAPNGSDAKTHTAFGFATQLCILDAEGRLERIVAAHDVGRAINPAFCEGQIEGAVHMGLGYALTEELLCPEGMPATSKLLELGVLRATDMPAVDVILIEDPEPEGPFGAKGLGEIGLVPTAAAVAGALEAFDGIRRMTLPMKDSAAARSLRAGKKG